MKNTIHTFTNGNLVGTLCINDDLEGFLHYNHKYANTEVCSERDIDDLRVISVEARKLCRENGANLIMY